MVHRHKTQDCVAMQGMWLTDHYQWGCSRSPKMHYSTIMLLYIHTIVSFGEASAVLDTILINVTDLNLSCGYTLYIIYKCKYNEQRKISYIIRATFGGSWASDNTQHPIEDTVCHCEPIHKLAAM